MKIQGSVNTSSVPEAIRCDQTAAAAGSSTGEEGLHGLSGKYSYDAAVSTNIAAKLFETKQSAPARDSEDEPQTLRERVMSADCDPISDTEVYNLLVSRSLSPEVLSEIRTRAFRRDVTPVALQCIHSYPDGLWSTLLIRLLSRMRVATSEVIEGLSDVLRTTDNGVIQEYAALGLISALSIDNDIDRSHSDALLTETVDIWFDLFHQTESAYFLEFFPDARPTIRRELMERANGDGVDAYWKLSYLAAVLEIDSMEE